MPKFFEMFVEDCRCDQVSRIANYQDDVGKCSTDDNCDIHGMKSTPSSSSVKNADKGVIVDDNANCERCGSSAYNNTTLSPPFGYPSSQSTMVNESAQSLLSSRHRNESSCSVTIPVITEELQLSRRPSTLLQEILQTRRPSTVMAAMRTQQRPRIMGSLYEDPDGCNRTMNNSFTNVNGGPNCDLALKSKCKNRRIGDDALSTALSALYCKLLVILGVAMPVTEIISSKVPTYLYQSFYVYLYLGSITFVVFVYAATMKTRALFSILKTYHEKANNVHIKKKAIRFGSFYLRVGAIAFGIGTMVYSGLEFGQYFELQGKVNCSNIFIALTPAARMALSIVQMQFIFLNTTELDMARHKVIARFGLMHMVATNLCEWLYVLVEETKHEIYHFLHSKVGHMHHSLGNSFYPSTIDANSLNAMTTNETFIFNDVFNSTNSSTQMSMVKQAEVAQHVNCHRTKIMGSLVQNASPFLFPCTIEYSLICAVILYEMWKKVKSIPDIAKSRNDSQKPSSRSAHHFSVDCSRAHRGLFAGILATVMTIISMIMYFVLHEEEGFELIAMQEVTICETVMYSLTSIAVIAAMVRMRDLKFLNRNDKTVKSMNLDCTLLVLAQTGVYVYGMFSIMGSYFSLDNGISGGKEALFAEVTSLFQTSIQTLFILNSCWRRCKGAQQQRSKPGRELITFLLIANVSLWFINTLIKGRAAFRQSHLEFFGVWAWTIITHVSMPLAIFYRFHSTICLFEIWKSAYKPKN